MKNSRNIINTGIQAILILTCLCSFLQGVWSSITSQIVAGSYFVVTLTSLITLAILHVPKFLAHKNVLAIPVVLQTSFSIFTFCAMFLGEIFDFYTRFSWWDTLLHFSSGILFSIVGYLLFISFNRDIQIRRYLSPLSILLFAICFSIACGVLWEIFEFAGDTLLGMNMQKWQSDVSPEEWAAMLNHRNSSNPGLINTMKDMIADTLGSICSIVVLLPMVKHNNHYVKAQISSDALLAESRAAFAQLAMQGFDNQATPGKELTVSKQNSSLIQTYTLYDKHALK